MIGIGEIEERLPEALESISHGKRAVLVDENTAEHCLPLVTGFLSPYLLIEIPSGETHKNLDTCVHIWDALTRSGFHRNDLLINLGGGVICDMGGFCASTYKRGIRFINIPTTLLSMVDASVGGKLGIDFGPYKNHIGSFSDPSAVLADTRFLTTLPARELRSGFAEVIKHTLIRDAGSWNTLLSTPFESLHWAGFVENSIRIKSEVVNSDPFENGPRKILNFGHSIGHGIESYLLGTENHLLHGESIAAGIIMESWLSMKLCDLPQDQMKAISDYLVGIYGKVELNGEDIGKISELMLMDKKNRDERMLFALIPAIGSARFDVEVTRELLSQSFDYYQSI